MNNFTTRAEERMKRIDERITRMEKFIAQRNKAREHTKNIIFIFIILIVTLVILAISTIAHAGAYYPPRIQQICSDHFIGSNPDDPLPFHAKRCHPLWQAWTAEILSTSPY